MSDDPEARLAAARAFDSAPPSWTVSLHRDIPREADVLVLGPDVEGEGLRFDVDTASGLVDAVSRVTARAGRVFVISGVGRGVGSTTVALHLAGELAREHDTCYVDLDTDFGAGDRLGLDDDHLTWKDIGDSSESLLLATVPVAGGFRALLAEPGAKPPPGLIPRLASAFDRVVVDCPCDRAVEVALEHADAAAVVVPASGLGARRLDRVAARFESIPYALVANRMGPGSEATGAGLRRATGRSFAVELPCCGRLREAEDRGALFTSPLSRWKWSIARLAGVLEQS